MELKRVSFLLVAVAVLLAAPALAHDDEDEDLYQAPADTHVVELTSENFKFKVLEGNWLVKFYAPWCGHCKHLAPIWDEAAESLVGTMNLGKVDCTVHSDVCNAYAVRGYPSLKYFRSGTPREYRGGRSLEAIVAYASRVTGPALADVSSTNLKSFLSGAGTKFLYFTTGSVKQDDVLMNVAERFVDIANFGMTGEAQLASKYGVTDKPTVVAIRGDSKDDVESYAGEWNTPDIGEWAAARLLPVFGELTATNAGDYMASELATVLTLVDPSTGSKSKALKAGREVAAAHQSKFNFAWVDAARLSDFIEQFELTMAELPQTVVWNSKDSLYYNNKSAAGVKELTAFLAAVQAGDIEAKGEGRGFFSDLFRWVDKFLTTVSPMWIAVMVLASFLACGGCVYYVLSDSPESSDVVPPSTLPAAHKRGAGAATAAAASAPAVSAAEKKTQ